MKYKRLLLGIMLSPIIVPLAIVGLLLIGIPTLICWGIEYVATGEYNVDDGGW